MKLKSIPTAQQAPRLEKYFTDALSLDGGQTVSQYVMWLVETVEVWNNLLFFGIMDVLVNMVEYGNNPLVCLSSPTSKWTVTLILARS